jgi:hypothetical protein
MTLLLLRPRSYVSRKRKKKKTARIACIQKKRHVTEGTTTLDAVEPQRNNKGFQKEMQKSAKAPPIHTEQQQQKSKAQNNNNTALQKTEEEARGCNLS